MISVQEVNSLQLQACQVRLTQHRDPQDILFSHPHQALQVPALSAHRLRILLRLLLSPSL